MLVGQFNVRVCGFGILQSGLEAIFHDSIDKRIDLFDSLDIRSDNGHGWQLWKWKQQLIESSIVIYGSYSLVGGLLWLWRNMDLEFLMVD